MNDEGVRWIVDSKTVEQEWSNLKKFFDDEMDRHRDQFESYEKLFRLQGETRPIKMALYYPLHQRLVKITEKQV